MPKEKNKEKIMIIKIKGLGWIIASIIFSAIIIAEAIGNL